VRKEPIEVSVLWLLSLYKVFHFSRIFNFFHFFSKIFSKILNFFKNSKKILKISQIFSKKFRFLAIFQDFSRVTGLEPMLDGYDSRAYRGFPAAYAGKRAARLFDVPYGRTYVRQEEASCCNCSGWPCPEMADMVPYPARDKTYYCKPRLEHALSIAPFGRFRQWETHSAQSLHIRH